MNIKWIGAILIIFGCSGAGFSIARAYRTDQKLLQNIIRAISYMENVLLYNLTPLPDLCRQAGKETSGIVHEVFLNLARELDWQIAPDAYSCMYEALGKSHTLSPKIRRYFLQLGTSLGRFDLTGQVRELEAIRSSCEKELTMLDNNLDNRIRSYKTLGICAGMALAILFI